MLNYLYLDYGGKPKYRAELKYSLISLRAELDPARARIVVASDAPEVYRAWPVTVMDIGPRIREWSGGGLYYHRIKPALVREALERFAEPVLFLDSDSIIRPGFHAEVEEKMAERGGDEPVREKQSLSAAQGLSHPAAASGRLSLRRGA